MESYPPSPASPIFPGLFRYHVPGILDVLSMKSPAVTCVALNNASLVIVNNVFRLISDSHMFDYDEGRSTVKFLQFVVLVRKDSPFEDVTHRVTKVPPGKNNCFPLDPS